MARASDNEHTEEMSFEERLAALEKKVKEDHFRSKARRRKEGSKKVQTLSRVLPALQQALGLDQKVKELALLSLWTHVVEERFREVTKPYQIKNEGYKKILVVAVVHGAIGTELSFSLPAIKAKLNQYHAQTGVQVDDIQFIVKPF